MRACDSCNAQKERCTFSGSGSSCDRCARLSRPCTNQRPTRRLGRRPLRPESLQFRRSNRVTSLVTVERGLPLGFLADSLQPCEEFLIRQLSDPSQLAGFNVAPKIAADVHQQVMYTLLHHYPETHDGFVSCYAAFASQKLVEVPMYVGDSIKRGNVALRNFRQFKPPTDLKEFVPWIWLSLCVALHIRCALGWSASSIRRYVLSHIAQLGDAGTEMASHPIVIIMIIGDIYECLLHCETPLMNLPERDLEHQGAFVYMCAPLIRHLFEICKIRASYNQRDDSKLAPRLSEIERAVQTWNPELDSAVVEGLSEVGLIQLEAQIRAFTQAVLLCVQRSRHDSSSGDILALAIARQIIFDLDSATSKCGRAPSCVSLPFMIAAIEIKDSCEQAKLLGEVSLYVTGTPFGIHDSFRTTLGEIWKSRSQENSWTITLQRIPSSQITI